jgi:transcriptional regulator with XRE-family HTH domain
MSNFSERLKEIRISTKLSQKKVAEITGISISVYQEYEYGTIEPTISRLEVLSRCFQISADWLLGISDDPTIHSPTSAAPTELPPTQ